MFLHIKGNWFIARVDSVREQIKNEGELFPDMFSMNILLIFCYWFMKLENLPICQHKKIKQFEQHSHFLNKTIPFENEQYINAMLQYFCSFILSSFFSIFLSLLIIIYI